MPKFIHRVYTPISTGEIPHTDLSVEGIGLGPWDVTNLKHIRSHKMATAVVVMHCFLMYSEDGDSLRLR